MVDNAAEPEGSAVREIERYWVWPGQACAYKIGQTVIARPARRGRAADGRALRHQGVPRRVLLGGAMPLTVLRAADQGLGEGVGGAKIRSSPRT